MTRFYKLTAFGLCLLLTGCAAPQSSGDMQAESAPAESAPAESAAETLPESSAEEIVYDYVHGEDGYFSLIDEGLGTPVKVQESGTCWVVSATTAMESNALVTRGETIEVDPYKLLDACYSRDRKEGWFLAENLSPESFGGWGWLAAVTLANRADGWLLTEANNYTGASREQLKEAIRTEGAVNIGITDRQSKKGFFGEYQTVNDPTGDAYDHAVDIVGWDDHFPKEYFREKAKQDGAWLIQNSTSEKYVFYWVSYETPIIDPYTFSVTRDYGDVIAYEQASGSTVDGGDVTVTANVFHHAGTLAAVGTYTVADGQKLTVEIRDAALENVLYTQDAQYDFMGYHLIDLDVPQAVSDYAIVIRYEGEAPVEGGSYEDSFCSYRPSADPGVSFIESDGEWLDLSANVTDPAYAPNNACIKAVYAK